MTPPALRRARGGAAQRNSGDEPADGKDPVGADAGARRGPRNREGLRERKPRSYSRRLDFERALAALEQPAGELPLAEQMSAKKGLKKFGEPGAEAAVEELRQLDQLKAAEPARAPSVTREQKRESPRRLARLKQKRRGRVKARGRAGG